MKPRNLILSLAAVASIGISFVPGELFASEGSERKSGEQTFIDVGCAACHGTVGQGTIAGPKLAPNPLPFEYFRIYLRSPTGVMPPYSETVLPDDEVVRIHQYLADVRAQERMPAVLKTQPSMR